MSPLSPSARPPGCPALVPIGSDGTCGYCATQRRHVYLEASDRCLCDHCVPDQNGSRVVNSNVYFVSNDIVMLHSEHAARLAEENRRATAMQCAPKTPKVLDEPIPDALPKPEPEPRRKPGLLAFT